MFYAIDHFGCNSRALVFWAVLLMGAVSLACAAAAAGALAAGWLGYWTALVILSINVFGDVLSATFVRDWRTLIGLPIGGAMIA
jgi:hypothetical protein